MNSCKPPETIAMECEFRLSSENSITLNSPHFRRRRSLRRLRSRTTPALAATARTTRPRPRPALPRSPTRTASRSTPCHARHREARGKRHMHQLPPHAFHEDRGRDRPGLLLQLPPQGRLRMQHLPRAVGQSLPRQMVRRSSHASAHDYSFGQLLRPLHGSDGYATDSAWFVRLRQFRVVQPSKVCGWAHLGPRNPQGQWTTPPVGRRPPGFRGPSGSTNRIPRRGQFCKAFRP